MMKLRIGKELWNETLDKKGHFFDEEVNFQEEFWLTKEYQKWLVSKMLSLKAYCGNKLFTLVFWSLEGQMFCLLGTTSIPTFITQNGKWPLGGGGGGLSNGRFPWTKWDFCSEVKKLQY